MSPLSVSSGPGRPRLTAPPQLPQWCQGPRTHGSGGLAKGVIAQPHLVTSSEAVRVRRSRWERIGSLHADLYTPIDHIVSSDVVDDPWPFLRGWRAPGTDIPYVILL